ncbi:gram-negative porin family protein [Ehrlichia chaffeensis str. Heartland]|nr:gram-negative porin family protein [Ehrlichia chaffeensis str. Heartland]AHX06592.1 gram-negative porin family protein [Ehrlichia chaffeensis str. Liberty]AHX07669.1 gram-negative porin family protein [Ehrlichia chaffeensis str. Osceola]AHX08785.1 gram-negative porin family protein [Ehrlichia chaffeensis str. Saint Vincent]AHX09528.1 gram-negative porin family protein [Ehrlichia chaffeensis str. Wakulla]AHX10733.1 gram-negative porin family protein [Ehrlichia chaffeensis str. West Paces]
MCRKLLYISAIFSLMLFINQATANDFALSGKLNLQYGFNSNDFSRLSFNATSTLEYSYHINDYFSVGPFLKLSTNLMSNSIDSSGNAKDSILDINSNTKEAYVFIKSSNIGSLQVGLTSPVSQKMKLSSSDISVASGGVTGSWLQYVNLRTDNSNFSYGHNKEDTVLFTPGLYIAYHGSAIPVVSYYSPQIKGIKLGLSYIPKDKIQDIANNIKSHVYKNIVSVGVKYQNQLSSGIGYSISGVVEHAVNDLLPASNQQQQVQYNNLLSYNAGFSLKYNNITFIGSYGNLGNSGKKEISVQSNHYKIIDSEFYDLGLKIENDLFNVGLSYFYGGKKVNLKTSPENYAKHALSACALGIEKILRNNMILYADIVFFDVDRTDTNKSGYIGLIGAKLSF